LKIALQAFGREDFQRLIEWAVSPEFLLQWAGPIFRFPLDIPQLEEYLAAAGPKPPSRVIFKAVSGTEVVGHIDLDMIDYRNRSGRMSRVLVADAWRGRGAGRAMVQALLDLGFGELGLHRIDLFVFDFNLPAIACYEKAGFAREGHVREARRMGDAFWSLYQMSMLRDEWRNRPPDKSANGRKA
jgi:RimJ/RimL family protein N-acetyltransferase